ncbi:MAG: hypothetical protein H8E84_09055 [Flavobacteriales bacterium]|nr:hypothetical protein [Flavobacteriales bacterium]
MQELISTINKNLPKGFKEDACEYFYNCKSCGKLLKAQNGDCCVFCTYGNTPCPSIQEKNDCCK